MTQSPLPRGFEPARLSVLVDDTLTLALDTREEEGVASFAPLGDRINGRYEVTSVIGHGGMGVVYRVRDHVHPELDVALKMIRGRLLQQESINWFKAEFKAMAELRHPNIARVYDFEQAQGT